MEIEELALPRLEAVLKEWAETMREAYTDKLTMSERIASGALVDSVRAEVERNGARWAIVFNLADYWKYVEYDTPPHWMPSGTLVPWIRVKPVIPRPDKNGRIPSEESLDFLIRRHIAGQSPKQLSGEDPDPGGTRGSHDLEATIDKSIEAYTERATEALAQDISEWLEVEINKISISIDSAL